MNVDVSELQAFAAWLRSAGRQVESEAPRVVKRGALNVKTQARANLGNHKSMPWLQRSITFDVTESGGLTEAEIGPDQAISGLGEGVEFGSVHHDPIPFLYPAADTEEPRFDAAVDAMLSKAFDL